MDISSSNEQPGEAGSDRSPAINPDANPDAMFRTNPDPMANPEPHPHAGSSTDPGPTMGPSGNKNGYGASPEATQTFDLADFTNMIGFANASAALEILLTVKTEVRNAAFALTECATPEVRAVVRKQLFQALDTHEQITNLMMRKGWFQPYNLTNQFQIDLTSAQMTANIARMPLFKDRSKVLEAFDTPN